MRVRFLILLISGTLFCSAQQTSAELNDIYKRLENLEKAKSKDSNVKTIDIIKNGNKIPAESTASRIEITEKVISKVTKKDTIIPKRTQVVPKSEVIKADKRIAEKYIIQQKEKMVKADTVIKIVEDSIPTKKIEVTPDMVESVDTFQPKIEFKITKIKTKNINQGDVHTETFEFTNTGNDYLEILSVAPDCSCTSPEFSQGPIAPGAKGFVKVSYDSTEDIGDFLKTVTVIHNSGKGYTFLELRGFVNAKF